MEWNKENRLKLARNIRQLAIKIQEEEFSKHTNFPDMVNKTIQRIMEKLQPLGFERANNDFNMDSGEHLGEGHLLHIYKESKTHLWFETAQCRIVKIRKELAEKVLILGIP